jgi:hypothetical protein
VGKVSQAAGEKFLLRLLQEGRFQGLHADAKQRRRQPKPLHFEPQKTAKMPGVGHRFAKPDRDVMPAFLLRNKRALKMTRPQLLLLQQTDKSFEQHGTPGFNDLGLRCAIFKKMLDPKRWKRTPRDHQLGPLAQELIEPQADLISKTREERGAFEAEDLADRSDSQAMEFLRGGLAKTQPFDRQIPQKLELPAGKENRLCRMRQIMSGCPGCSDRIADGNPRLETVCDEFLLQTAHQRKLSAKEMRDSGNVQQQAVRRDGLFQTDARAVLLATEGKCFEGDSVGLGLHGFNGHGIPPLNQRQCLRQRHSDSDATLASPRIAERYKLAAVGFFRQEQDRSGKFGSRCQKALQGPVRKPQTYDTFGF